MNQVVVHYHEVALKRGNRPRFVSQLTQNILRMLRGTGVSRVRHAAGRLVLALDADHDWPEIRARLGRVSGVANFLLCQRTERSVEALIDRILAVLEGRSMSRFAVRAKRADKTFPLQSPEICRLVGRAVQERTGWPVDLDHPEVEIHIEMLRDDAFFALEKLAGPGGLPVGSSGTVLALLSGGIDSPVAAHRMMRRGCRVEFVHFHGAPYQSRASQEKALELVEVLSRWQPDARLQLVPFGDIQRQIVARVSRRVRVVLYRRMMLRIAEVLAAGVGAAALVTGESLGQVASQTLPNLAVIEDACRLPVLRPLIGMDKQEISAQAERLGTFAISIQPDEDCCQLFVPRHPATRMTPAEAEAAEAPLDVPALVAGALERVQAARFAFPEPVARIEAAPSVPATAAAHD